MSNQQIVEAFSLSHAQVLDGDTSFLDALAAAAAENEDIYGVNDSSLDPDIGDFDNEGDDAVLSTWSWLNFVDLSVQAGYFSLPLYANLTGQAIETIGSTTAVDEVQTVTITGAPTGGTFTLTFQGQTTAGISSSALATAVQSALVALPNLDTGDVVVTGAGGGPWTVTFGGGYAGQAVSQMTADGSNLTGGTDPDVDVATTTPGSAAGGEAYAVDLWSEESFNVPPKPMVVRMPSKDRDGNPRSMAIGLYRVQFRPITFDGPTYKDGLKTNYAGRAVQSLVDEVGAEFPDGKKRTARLLSYA